MSHSDDWRASATARDERRALPYRASISVLVMFVIAIVAGMIVVSMVRSEVPDAGAGAAPAEAHPAAPHPARPVGPRGGREVR